MKPAENLKIVPHIRNVTRSDARRYYGDTSGDNALIKTLIEDLKRELFMPLDTLYIRMPI